MGQELPVTSYALLGLLTFGDELTEGGFDTGVLRSDDYPSLNPGFWVA